MRARARARAPAYPYPLLRSLHCRNSTLSWRQRHHMPINLTYCWLAVLSLGTPCLTLRAAVAVQRGTRTATAVQISNKKRVAQDAQIFALYRRRRRLQGQRRCLVLQPPGRRWRREPTVIQHLLGSSIGLAVHVHPAHNRGREFNLSFCDITMAVAPSGALKHTMLPPHAVRNNAPVHCHRKHIQYCNFNTIVNS